MGCKITAPQQPWSWLGTLFGDNGGKYESIQTLVVPCDTYQCPWAPSKPAFGVNINPFAQIQNTGPTQWYIVIMVVVFRVILCKVYCKLYGAPTGWRGQHGSHCWGLSSFRRSNFMGMPEECWLLSYVLVHYGVVSWESSTMTTMGTRPLMASLGEPFGLMSN